MNHARVKALKGNSTKTTSKKAIKSGRASKNATPRDSPYSSLLNSPAQSATPSRAGSDASSSEYEFDDNASSYAGSLYEVDETGGSSYDVNSLMDRLQDRKHHNGESREEMLEGFIRYLRGRYGPNTHNWLDSAAQPLCELFIRGANRGATARERMLYLQAYTVTMTTADGLRMFGQADNTLRQIVADDDDEECKAWGLYALAVTTLFGGGGEDEAQSLIDYYFSIIESDGENIDAYDAGFVVSAALKAWSFVCSHVEDFSYSAAAALDNFYEQLDSDDIHVQSNAAACIALMFEGARNHEEETGESWDLPINPEKLTGRMTQLAKNSSKHVSKKDRRDRRSNLISVITSLEKGVGPGYSTVQESRVGDDGEIELGYRNKIRIGEQVAIIDSWSLSSRFHMMKLIFAGHLRNHIFDNPVVSECLEDADFKEQERLDEPRKSKKSSLKHFEAVHDYEFERD